jgi:fatty-acyl-CoA synthase
MPSYGMAEATLAITFAPLGDGLKTDVNEAGHELVDCGRAFPEHELAVVDEQGRRLGERQIGQIVTRGPSVTRGYYNEPELTAQTYRPLPGEGPDPWLHTGDLGYLVNGRLFICGRLKDMVIVRGRNYYPSDIEWAVTEASSDAAARRGNVVAFGVFVDAKGRASGVSGGGSREGGSREEQLVVCCEGHSSEVDAIRQTATAVLASRFGLTVHEVVVTPLASLPRTSSGKPKRSETRQRYLDGSLPRARGVQTAQSQPQHPGDGAPESTG